MKIDKKLKDVLLNSLCVQFEKLYEINEEIKKLKEDI